MRSHLRQFPLWLSILTILLAVALGVTLSVLLRRDVISTDTAAERATRSALLPDEWKTYEAEHWSVGYPGEWSAIAQGEGMTFRPEDATTEENYLSIDEVSDYTPRPDALETSEFLFAGYETTKYTYAAYTVYVVDYDGQLFRISTEFADEPEVGIMLATFQFLR